MGWQPEITGLTGSGANQATTGQVPTYFGRWPYLAGLNQSNPIIADASISGNQGRVWHLPLSKRVLAFDEAPFHYMKKKVYDHWYQVDGLSKRLLL